MEKKKAVWGSREVQVNSKVKILNIICATINNYSNDVVTFIHNGIKRELPPVDATLNIPSASFEINLEGFPFDLDLAFEFPTGKGNNVVIIDYGEIKEC